MSEPIRTTWPATRLSVFDFSPHAVKLSYLAWCPKEATQAPNRLVLTIRATQTDPGITLELSPEQARELAAVLEVAATAIRY